MRTPKEFIIERYGENWLRSDWTPGDTMDAMEEYAKSINSEAGNETPTVTDNEHQEKVYHCPSCGIVCNVGGMVSCGLRSDNLSTEYKF